MEVMRFSEMARKEVINFENGKCMGVFADCDLRINPEDGKIKEIILAGNTGCLNLFFSTGPSYVIPWQSVVRIGIDTIIVTIAEDN